MIWESQFAKINDIVTCHRLKAFHIHTSWTSWPTGCQPPRRGRPGRGSRRSVCLGLAGRWTVATWNQLTFNLASFLGFLTIGQLFGRHKSQEEMWGPEKVSETSVLWWQMTSLFCKLAYPTQERYIVSKVGDNCIQLSSIIVPHTVVFIAEAVPE